jgi:hypothetical protein
VSFHSGLLRVEMHDKKWPSFCFETNLNGSETYSVKTEFKVSSACIFKTQQR